MAFNYDLSSSTSSIVTVSKIRLAVGDTVLNKGARPRLENFSDAEILFFYSEEGNHLKRATAAAFEALSAFWSSYAGSKKLGPESRSSRQAAAFAQAAARLRDQFGYADDDTQLAKQGGLSIPVKHAGQG